MELCGVLIINKPQGFTSHDVVNKIRRLYGTKKVGHTGTLDPLATGVLVVLVGRAAKAAEYISSESKAYTATMKLGLSSDTEDICGNILSRSDTLPSSEQVIDTASKFVGDLMQIPPMYSAIKVNGQKLYDLARQGVSIERAPRPITVHSICCTPTDSKDEYLLSVSCSAGTYIRTLCADIGATLGCGGLMKTLCRTSAGDFSIEDSYTLEELEALPIEERISLLRPIESLFSSLPTLRLSAFYERLSRSGCEIYQHKIKTNFGIGERIRLCSDDGAFYALGEVFDFDGKTAIKSIKMFDIKIRGLP